MTSTSTPYFAVDPLPPSAVTELLGVWYQAKEQLPDARLYALIDTAFDEAACASYLDGRAEGDRLSLYEGLMLEELGAVSPWLVRLNSSDRAALTQELEALRVLRGSRPMLSFVASALDLPALQRHFKPFVEVVIEGDLALFMRFADTRIIDPLFDVLTPEQKTAFVPPDMGLWFPRRQSGSVGGVLPKTLRPDAVPLKQLHLDGKQFGRLIDAGDADLVINALTTTDALIFGDARPSDVHRFITRQIERAATYRLSDKSSLETYCATAWATSPEFDRHPEFAYVIQQASVAPGQLAKLMREVPLAAWAAAASMAAPRAGV